VLALLRFHWAAGARVALRANAVVLGVIVFVFGSAPDGLATLRGFVLGVVAREHGGASRGVLAAIAFAFAGTAVPRVLLGASGWMRSLPVDARASWRAAVAALCVAQLAVATFIPISVSLAVFVYHADLSPAKIVALPVMIVAVAPGLFSGNSNGQGVAAALVLRVKGNGTQVFEQLAVFDPGTNSVVAVPIDLGPPEDEVFLVLYGTGMRFRSSLSGAQLTVGGTALEVLFLGSHSVFVGLDQLNARLPRSLAGRGEVSVVLVVDGKPANVVTINIR